MLNTKNLYSWRPDSIVDFLEDKELLKIAKKIYAEQFKEFCVEFKEYLKNETTKEKFLDFVRECLLDNEREAFLVLLEEFAKSRKLKACFCDAFKAEHDDYFWTLYITQVTPLNKEDIEELVYVYMKETNGCTELSEIVTHKIIENKIKRS